MELRRKEILEHIESYTGEATDIIKIDEKSDALWVMEVVDSPGEGVNTYSTLLLSEVDLGLVTGEDKPMGVEFLMVANESYGDKVPLILASCGLNVPLSELGIEPGKIFDNVMPLYYKDSPMKHILFVNPFIWDFDSMNLPGKCIVFLQAIPISDKEKSYADENGVEALEDFFEENEIDIFDFYRPSVF